MANVENSFDQPDSTGDNAFNIDGETTINTQIGKPFFDITRFHFYVSFPDVSTASSVYIPAPVSGNITVFRSVTDGTTTGAADAITTKINGVNITGGSWNITTATPGESDNAIPSALNSVSVGDVIEIESDGGSTGGPCRANIAFTIDTNE